MARLLTPVLIRSSRRPAHYERVTCAGPVLLTDDADWGEIRELMTESYRILAPEKLAALLG